MDLSTCGSIYGFNLGLSEEVTESILTDYLRQQGGEVNRSSRLIGLTPHADGALAEIERDGECYQMKVRWVVGCDGVHSPTRELSGIGFEGHDFAKPWAVFDATLQGWTESFETTFVYFGTLPTIFTAIPGRRWRVYLRPSSEESDLVADAASILRVYAPAGHRVMRSITRFITQRLKLQVNETKSAVARPRERKFLGFSFTDDPEIRRAIAPKALERFKDKIREITRQAKGVSIETTVKKLATYMVGWRGYFGFCETPEVLIGLIRWVRLRLRCALWRQWKTPRRRRAALLQLGVRPRLVANTAGSGRGPWYLARSKALSVGASNAYFRSLGLPSLFENY